MKPRYIVMLVGCPILRDILILVLIIFERIDLNLALIFFSFLTWHQVLVPIF
jgi:hypothetical protein